MNSMCIDIINSNSPWYEDHYHFKDGLTEREWLKWFLKRWDFPAELAEREDRTEQLSGLRSLLTKAVDAVIAGDDLPEDISSEMNRYFTGSAMRYEVKGQGRQYQLSLVPQTSDWNYVLSEIAASFVRLVNEFDITRFKRCENPDCLSVFLDISKNQSRKWCCNSCSSLIKVRRFREKRKEA